MLRESAEGPTVSCVTRKFISVIIYNEISLLEFKMHVVDLITKRSRKVPATRTSFSPSHERSFMAEFAMLQNDSVSCIRSEIASASAAVSRGVLATLILAALLGTAAESTDGAVSGVFGRAGNSGELHSIAMATKIITIFAGRGRRQLREDLGGLLSGAGGGEGDEEE